jgi:indole-3-glycerol phosphate synthase
MHNKLLAIIEKKKEDLQKQMQHLSLQELKTITTISQKENLFLKKILEAETVALIAEVKFASPTNSSLGSTTELLERVKAYEQAGAEAISIITEPHFFKGDTEFIKQVKQEVSLPLLQKDFIIDEYQIYEAKNIGSDALLLIARLLDQEKLKSFVRICHNLNIEPVVEINNEEDLEKAVETSTKIIAVNARDLETFHVDISIACRLMKKIPNNFIKLGFSGISSAVDVKQYKDAGARGVLIGTSLMQAENVSELIKELKTI